jgi:hypothetical protein
MELVSGIEGLMFYGLLGKLVYGWSLRIYWFGSNENLDVLF